MARIHFLALLLCALIALVSAGAPTYCKCTCFKNSTIILLGPENKNPELRSIDTTSLPSHGLDERSASTSCSACTKAFCLAQGIDICKDATEADVFTMCFQRDSNKDKIIVWGFIMGTLGLLGFAAFKRFNERRLGVSVPRQGMNYAPVAAQ